jgi:hypothetical protein
MFSEAKAVEVLLQCNKNGRAFVFINEIQAREAPGPAMVGGKEK